MHDCKANVYMSGTDDCVSLSQKKTSNKRPLHFTRTQFLFIVDLFGTFVLRF